MRRIVTAREQYETLHPWLFEADVSIHPEATPPGFPGQGRSPVIPAKEKNIGEDTPWARHDWRDAVANGTYGHFDSPARPSSSADTPHPQDLLATMKPYLTNQPRKLKIEDEAGNKKTVDRPSWRQMIENAKEPDVDPAGLLPPHETFRMHVEHEKERLRRARGYGSPEGGTQLHAEGEPANPLTVPDFDSQLEHARNRVGSGQEEDKSGHFWYAGAGDRAGDIAGKTHGDIERTLGTDSALSPLKDWDLNTEQSAHFNTHYPYGKHPGVGPVAESDDPERRPGTIGEPQEGWRVPAPNTQNEKSRRILDAPPGATRDDLIDILQGPKTSSFMGNIKYGHDNPLREPRTFGQAHQDFMDVNGDKMADESESPYYHGGDPEMAKATVPNDEGFHHHQINPHTSEPDFRYGNQDTTADTHHVRGHSFHPDADLSGMSYGTPDWFSDKMTVGGKTHHLGYELSQRINQTANAEMNAEEPDPYRHTLPMQAQAGMWGQWKGTLDAAGKGAGFNPPGMAPKSYDPARKNWGLGPLYKGTDPETGKQMVDPNPAPKHQYEPGDWMDPRRPSTGPAFKGDWGFEEPPEGSGEKGRWIPPERATTTHTNEPRRGDPQSITQENYDPRMSPNWHRRDRYHQFMGVVDPHLAAYYSMASEEYHHPWETELGPCAYCGAGDDQACDPRCPTHHSDDPRQWAQEKALMGPGGHFAPKKRDVVIDHADEVPDYSFLGTELDEPYELPSEAHPMFRQNSVLDVVRYADRLLTAEGAACSGCGSEGGLCAQGCPTLWHPDDDDFTMDPDVRQHNRIRDFQRDRAMQEMVGPAFEPSPIIHLNSVQDALDYADNVLSYSAGVERKSTPADPDFGKDWQQDVLKELGQEGGYSRRGWERPPPSGYMVSLPKHEKIQPAEGFTGQDAADYGTQKWPMMKKDKSLWQGGWHEDDDPDFYHDVSRRHEDIWDAAKAGYGENEEEAQHGFYDLKNHISPSPLEFTYQGTPGLWMARKEDD